MAKRQPSALQFRAIPADLAINLYSELVDARRLQLQPALNRAVREVGVARIDADLGRLVPAEALNHLASLGLRGERVFPVPALIHHAPPLIGYYRMLLGLSKKEFGQRNRLGYQSWVNAEERGALTPRLNANEDQFCSALIDPLAKLTLAMGAFDNNDLNDLSLLTLGSTLQGKRNNVIGAKAAEAVFAALRSAVKPWIVLDTGKAIVFRSPRGSTYRLIAASDPDIRLQMIDETEQPILAIEVKGGNDASNAHNRAGEAEKSHIKARVEGYVERWTVIKLESVDRARIAEETQSSTAVFEADEIMQRAGTDWERFRGAFIALVEKHFSSTEAGGET